MRKFLFLAISLLMISCSNMDDLSQNLNTEVTANRDAILSISDTGSVVTAETATQVAKNMLGKPESRSSEEVSVESMLDESGKEIAYVVNYGTNDGFVVVNANRQLSPVLAYSQTGHFDLTQAKGTPAAEWIAHMATVPTENMPDSISQSIAVEWNVMSRREVAYQQLNSRSTQEDPDVEATISQAIAKWRSQGYTVTPVKGANASSYPPKIANAITSIQNSGIISSDLDRSYILKKESRTTTQTGPYDKTQWNMYAPYNAAVTTFTPTLSQVALAVAKIIYYHKSPSSIDFQNLPTSLSTANASDPLPQFLLEVTTKCGLGALSSNKNGDINNAETGLKSYGYNYEKSGYDWNKVTTSLRSYGPTFFDYQKTYREDGIKHSESFSWLCDGSHVQSINTEYSVKVYSGDFGDIDPTAAFYTKASDYSSSSSARALHFVWGWGNNIDGYYYNSQWSITLGGETITIKGSDVKVLTNIFY